MLVLVKPYCRAVAMSSAFRVVKWGRLVNLVPPGLPLLLGVTLILMRPDMIASLIGMPHDQRYWVYPMGLALYGLVYLMQRPRMPKAEAAPATT